MLNMKLAFDRSARSIDADGRLHVERTHISKANICPYYGEEIPGWQDLGLQADSVYRLFRDPVELERAAPTFVRLPILSKHVPVTVDSPQPDLVVGAIGSNVAFNDPYLDADISVWDKGAIAGIETGAVKELSCAYRYVPVMTPGEYEGKAYDGVMTEIRGNHLALVEVGRAGADVVVADCSPFLGGVMPKKDQLKAVLIAKDATLSPQQLDNVIDALLDVEQENPAAPEAPAVEPVKPMATDETPEAKARAILEDANVPADVIDSVMGCFAAPAKDGYDEKEPEDMVKKEEMEAAMDSLGKKLQAEFKATSNAMQEVRPVVGDVFGMASAEAVYGFALDHMKVEHSDAVGAAAKRAVFRAALSAKNAAAAPVVAQDSGLAAAFPAVSRFSKF